MDWTRFMPADHPTLNVTGLCPDQQVLSKLLSGRLNRDELESIAGHVAVCGQCAKTLSTLENDQDDLLMLLREPIEADELSTADSTALIARVEAIRTSPKVASEFVPRTLGRYQLLGKLGEGGMGAVYKAMNVNLGKVVALKTLGCARVKDAAAIARLRREMKSVGALQHANIVGAHDADEIDGVHFLVMEYVEGLDLAELTRRLGRLDIADACELTRQAAVGLDYAHQHGLVHRDIKPPNLMLDGHAQLKVLDLGLALLAEDDANELTSAGSIMGTADYMAPEQAGDSHHVDARADVYSLGCTLFKLLSGRPPFAGPAYGSAIKKALAHATQPPPAIHDLRAEVPAGLGEIVARTLAKQPQDRFASAGDLATALAPFCGGSRLVELFERAAANGPSRSDVVIFADTYTDAGAGSSLVPTEPGEASAPAGEHPVSAGEPGASATGGSPAALPPRPPRRAALLGAAGAGALALLLGVIFVIRDRNGQELQRFEAPDGASVSIEKATAIPAPAPQPPAPAIAPFDANEARAYQAAWAKYLGTPVERMNSVGMTLTLIPPGEFLMGSTPEQMAEARKIAETDVHPEKNYWARIQLEAPQHRVRLTRPYRLGATEVTLGQFKKFVEATQYVTEAEQFGFGDSAHAKANDQVKARYHGLSWRSPSYPVTDDSPVTQVTWNDAVRFCNWLSGKEKLKSCYRQDARAGWVAVVSGTGYRLPTEAEWEFACRAGTTTQFSFGDNVASLDRYAWILENAHGAPRAVGLKLSNPFGLFDVHGNATEWCQDFYRSSYDLKSSPNDPAGPPPSGSHIMRGGNADSLVVNSRAATRLSGAPIARQKAMGFRVAVSQPAEDGQSIRAAGLGAAEDRPRPAVEPPPARSSQMAKPPAPAIAPFDANEARAYQAAWAKYLHAPRERMNVVGMSLVLIPPGKFLMGSTPEQMAEGRKIAEQDRERPQQDLAASAIKTETPQHQVTLTRPYWLGSMEVTVRQFKKFVEATKYVTEAEQFGFGNSPEVKANDQVKPQVHGLSWRSPSYPVTDDSPVTQVTWHDAVRFCNWLSDQDKLKPCYRQDAGSDWILQASGTGYRLPTEAEWEFACRAGTTTQFSFGDDVALLGRYAWIFENAHGAPRAAGIKPANPFGLFDMHGNVSEWCQDVYAPSYGPPLSSIDPTGAAVGSLRIARGGNANGNEFRCRSAGREHLPPTGRQKNFGFRVVCPAVSP
jgi:formylglycine-generating enzyme required for sulfatase activity